MLNKIFKLFATLSIVGVVAFGVGCSNYDNDIDNLQKQIDELEKGHSSSTSLIQGLRADLTALEAAAATTADLAAAKSDLETALAQQKSALDAEVAALKAADETLQNNLDKLDSDNQAAIEQLKKDIAAAAEKAYNDAVAEAVAQAGSKDDAVKKDLEEKIAAVNANLDAAKESLAKDIAEVSGKVAALEARIESIEGDIEALIYALYGVDKDEVANGNYSSESVYGQLAILMKQIANLQEDDAALQERIDDLDKDLSWLLSDSFPELTGRVVALEGTVNWMNNWLGEVADNYDSLDEFEAALLARISTNEEAIEALVTWSVEAKGLIANHADQLLKINSILYGFEEGETVKGYIAEYALSLAEWGVFEEGYKEFFDKTSKTLGEYDTKKIEWEARLQVLEEYQQTHTAEYETLKSDLATLQTKTTELDEYIFGTEENGWKDGLKAIIEQYMTNHTMSDEDIDNRIRNAVEEAKTAINEKIDALEAKVNTLAEELASLKTAQEDTAKKVDGLIKRIQSLVYLPDNANMVISIGDKYIEATDGRRIYLQKAPTKEVHYRISPAEIAQELVDNANWQFYAHAVTPATRTEVYEPIEVKIVDENGNPGKPKYKSNGEIIILLATEYKFDNYDLAVALNVSTEYTVDSEVEGEEGTTTETWNSGVKTEYTSPYTPMIYDGQNIVNDFVFAKQVENEETGELEWRTWGELKEKLATINNNKVATPVKVDGTNEVETYVYKYKWSQDVFAEDAEPLRALSEFEVVYKNGDECYTLAKAAKEFNWTAELAWKLNEETARTETYSNPAFVDKTYEDSNNTDVEDAYYNFKLTAADSKNVNTWVYSSAIEPIIYSNAIATLDDEAADEDGEDEGEEETPVSINVSLGEYSSAVLIIRDEFEVEIEADLIWNYNIWSPAWYGNATSEYTVDAKLTEPLIRYNFVQLWNKNQNSWTVTDEELGITEENETSAYKLFGTDGMKVTILQHATDRSYVDPGELLSLKVENYAYSNGQNTLETKHTYKTSSQFTNVTLKLHIDAPEARHIVLPAEIDNVYALNTPYLLSVQNTTADGEQLAALEGYAYGNFYSQYETDDLAKYFAAAPATEDEEVDLATAAANASKFVAQSALKTYNSPNPANNSFALVTEAEDCAATLYHNRIAGSNYYPRFDAPISTELNKNNKHFFYIQFSELTFEDGAEYVEFALPEGGIKLTSATGADYNVVLPEGATTIKVLNPAADVDFVHKSRLSGVDDVLKYQWHSKYYPADYVSLIGTRETNAYNYKNINLWEALDVKDKDDNTEKYWVDFKVVGPEAYGVVDADNGRDDRPTITLTEADPEANISWPTTYFTNGWADENGYYKGDAKGKSTDPLSYNYVEVQAQLKSRGDNGGIIYKTYNFTVAADLPFDAPTVTTPEPYKVADQLAAQHLISLIKMTDLANSSVGNMFESTNTHHGFKADPAAAYGLTITWADEADVKVVDVDTNEPDANRSELTIDYQVNGEDATFAIPQMKARLAHKFQVTIPFTIEGDFGYIYYGNVVLNIEPSTTATR